MSLPKVGKFGIVDNPLTVSVWQEGGGSGEDFTNTDFLLMDTEFFLLMDGTNFLTMTP